MDENVIIRYLNEQIEVEIPLMSPELWHFYEEDWWSVIKNTILASRVILSPPDDEEHG
jgi:hypothetical protein